MTRRTAALAVLLAGVSAGVDGQTAAKPAQKKAPVAAGDKDAQTRKQLRTILEPHTEDMLKCIAIQSQLLALLADQTITSVEELNNRTGTLQNDWVACVNDVKKAALAEFAKTGASEPLQQSAWSEWLGGVRKRRDQAQGPASAPVETKR